MEDNQKAVVPSQPASPVSQHPGRFSYVRYDKFATHQQEEFKAKFEELEQLTRNSLEDGRAKSLVLTKLEEAYMWVGKAIRDQQVARGGNADHQPARDNS